MPEMKRKNIWLIIILLCCCLLGLGYLLIRSLPRQDAKKVSAEKRYVVLSPEIAEIIALLEGTGNIVGITQECNFPSEYAAKTVVGQFGNVNREAILRLRPSLLFCSSLEQQAVAAELAKLGVRTMVIYPHSLGEMLQAITTIGNAIGQAQRAKSVRDSLAEELEAVKAKRLGKFRPKVYLEIYRNPLMSVSDSSFVGQLIELSGGDNVFDHLDRDYCRIKAEDVIRKEPDIIICYSQDSPDIISHRMGWKHLPAVVNHRIYVEKDINPDWLLRAGPRCVSGLKRLQGLYAANGW